MEVIIADQQILSKEEVISTGLLFDGDDVHWGGEYGQHVCTWTGDGSEEPVNGLLYEFCNSNDNLYYYQFYKDGIRNGPCVTFYDNGKIKRYADMYKGILHGKVISWNEHEQISLSAVYKYGYVVSCTEWDDEGNLIREQFEPDAFGKRMIEQSEAFERRLAKTSK